MIEEMQEGTNLLKNLQFSGMRRQHVHIKYDRLGSISLDELVIGGTAWSEYRRLLKTLRFQDP